MLLLTAQEPTRSEIRPISLPLWGSYDGSGMVVDLSEGENTRLLLHGLRSAVAAGELAVDFQSMQVPAMEMRELESFISLLFAGEIHGLQPLRWRGHSLSVALFEANVAAAVMQAEPERLRGVPVDGLIEEVFGQDPLASSLYAHRSSLGPAARCKFGLAAIALASLCESLEGNEAAFRGCGAGIGLEEAQPARWLAEAYEAFASNGAVTQALQDYTEHWAISEDGDEDAVWDDGEQG